MLILMGYLLAHYSKLYLMGYFNGIIIAILVVLMAII